VAHEVQPAVAVGVALRQQQAALRLGQARGDLEHELVQVTGSSLAAVRAQHLLAQLARPLALGLAGSFHTQPQPLLVAQRLALLAQPALEQLFALVAHACRLLERAGTLVHPAAPLLVERRSRGARPPFVGPARERRHRRNGQQDRQQIVDGVGEVASAPRDAQREHACSAEQPGGHADQHPAPRWAQFLHGVVA
jgi:hypothetical protein